MVDMLHFPVFMHYNTANTNSFYSNTTKFVLTLSYLSLPTIKYSTNQMYIIHPGH